MADEKDTLPNLEKMFEILLSIQKGVQETKREVQNNSLRLTALETGFNIFRVETNQRFDNVDARLENVENYAMLIMGKVEGLEKRNETLENRVEEGFEKMRVRFVNIDENFADFQKVAHKALSMSAETRGDVLLLREELYKNLVEKLGFPRRDPLAGI